MWRIEKHYFRTFQNVLLWSFFCSDRNHCFCHVGLQMDNFWRDSTKDTVGEHPMGRNSRDLYLNCVALWCLGLSNWLKTRGLENISSRLGYFAWQNWKPGCLKWESCNWGAEWLETGLPNRWGCFGCAHGTLWVPHNVDHAAHSSRRCIVL